MSGADTPVHAGLLARHIQGRWRGLLVRGASGVGKSDLALRALADGWRLVSDDRTLLWRSGEGRLYGRAHPRLLGLMEVRGLGLAALSPLPFCTVDLIVDACEAPERMPEMHWVRMEGVDLPHLLLPLRQPSSLAKLAHALEAAVDRRL